MRKAIVSADGKHWVINTETPLNVVMAPAEGPSVFVEDATMTASMQDGSTKTKSWEGYAERDLEELLMKNFELNFKTAAVKGYNQALDINESRMADAVAKVLTASSQRPGSGVVVQVGDDAKSTVVTLPVDVDIGELRKSVLWEMLGRMNSEKPQLSTGEALWRLLMCDVSKAMFSELKASLQQQCEAASTKLEASAKGVARLLQKRAEASAGDLTETTSSGGHSGTTDGNDVPVAPDGDDVPVSDANVDVLQKRIKELEDQLKERTDWAQQKVLQVTQRLSKDVNELKQLRAEREESVRAETSKAKRIADIEAAMKKCTLAMEQATVRVKSMEDENAILKAELEAAKLSAAESGANYSEVLKREKKSARNAQSWEKQKSKLQEELAAEKRRSGELQQQVLQAREAHQQAEVRVRQEIKAKEEAVLKAEVEKTAREDAQAASKRREVASSRKSEEEIRRLRDDLHRLEDEVRECKSGNTPKTPLSWEASFVESVVDEWDDDSPPQQQLQQSAVRRDRECVMCLCEEKTVVFLPCAHQVVCVMCNELHLKQGLTDCPSCRTTIQQRIVVYGK